MKIIKNADPEFLQEVPYSLDKLVEDLNVWTLEPLHISVVVSNHLQILVNVFLKEFLCFIVRLTQLSTE